MTEWSASPPETLLELSARCGPPLCAHLVELDTQPPRVDPGP